MPEPIRIAERDTPDGVLSTLPLPVTDRTVTGSSFVCPPLALALAVIARAGVSMTPADAVVAAFAVPRLLATTWTLGGVLRTSTGVSPGSPVSLGAGLLPSVVPLADGVIARVAVPERTRVGGPDGAVDATVAGRLARSPTARTSASVDAGAGRDAAPGVGATADARATPVRAVRPGACTG